MVRLSTRARSSPATIVFLVVALLAVWAFTNPAPTAGAQATNDDSIIGNPPPPPMHIGFAKYDGFDGESDDGYHDKWIDILTLDWGGHLPDAAGQSRRRGTPIGEDLVFSFYYEKAAPKAEEAMFKGAVIPELEVELIDLGGNVYLRYELKNVRITGFDVHAAADTGGRAIITVAHNFEEVKVAYTEYDGDGAKGDLEYEWKVEKAKK